MIGVSSSNKSFRVLARYLSEGRTGVAQNRVGWVASRNLPTDDPELAARIMRATAGQNVRVKEPVYHLALSFDPGDAVDRAAMERVADRVLETLGLQEHQVLIVAHADRKHAHMHLMVNRVHPETGRSGVGCRTIRRSSAYCARRNKHSVFAECPVVSPSARRPAVTLRKAWRTIFRRTNDSWRSVASATTARWRVRRHRPGSRSSTRQPSAPDERSTH